VSLERWLQEYLPGQPPPIKKEAADDGSGHVIYASIVWMPVVIPLCYIGSEIRQPREAPDLGNGIEAKWRRHDAWFHMVKNVSSVKWMSKLGG